MATVAAPRERALAAKANTRPSSGLIPLEYCMILLWGTFGAILSLWKISSKTGAVSKNSNSLLAFVIIHNPMGGRIQRPVASVGGALRQVRRRVLGLDSQLF